MIREYFQNGGQGMGWASQARPELPLPDKDARHYALQALIGYVANLTFQMTGSNGGQPITVKILPKNIYETWPDNEELLDRGEEDFPRVAFDISESTEDYPGLVPHEIDGTDDLYGQGTVLMTTAEHVENLALHVLCRSEAERRAVLAGLLQAFNPSQDFTGMRFVLPDYFNATCRFTLETGGRQENPDEARNRRSILLQLTMRVPNIYLVRLERMVPTAEVEVGPDEVIDVDPIKP